MTRTKSTHNNQNIQKEHPQKTITKTPQQVKEPTEIQMKYKELNHHINPLYGNKLERYGFKYKKMNDEICHAVFGYDARVYHELFDRKNKEKMVVRFQRLQDKYPEKMVVNVDAIDVLLLEADKVEEIIFSILCERMRVDGNMIKILREIGEDQIRRHLDKDHLNKLFYKDQLIEAIEKLLVYCEHIGIE